MRFGARLVLLLMGLAALAPARAQIVPAAGSGSKISPWVALGVQQDWSPRWSTVFLAGYASQSDPDRLNAFDKLGNFMLSQETGFKPSKNWDLMYCTSFRIQGRYRTVEPFDRVGQGDRYEQRHYLRIHYSHGLGRRMQVRYSFRPEYRIYYRADGTPYDPDRGIRYRPSAQLKYDLDSAGANQIVINEELLWESRRGLTTDGRRVWSPYSLTNSRFSVFYRRKLRTIRAWLDVGLMYQTRFGTGNLPRHAFYPGIDLIFLNPFSRR